MPTARAVLWDLGNTLLDWDPARLYRQMLANDEAVTQFLGDICTMDWHLEHDRGVPMAENRKALIAAHPDKAELIEAWDMRWADMFHGWVEGMDILVAELEAQAIPQYALSNMPAEKWIWVKQTYPAIGRFLNPVISAQEGVVKPDPRIYQITIERISHNPEETVFIDDRADNIQAAEAHGFIGIQFINAEETRLKMRAMGLPV